MFIKDKRREDRRRDYKQAEEWHRKAGHGLVAERRRQIRRQEDVPEHKDFIWYHGSTPGPNGVRKIVLDRVSLIIRDEGAKHVIEMSGELSHADHGEVRDILDAVSRKGYPTIEVRLRDLNGMDSAGVGLLVGLYLCQHRQKARLTIAEVPESIYRLLLNCRLQKILPIQTC